MLKELLYHIIYNTGSFLMVGAILGLISTILISRLGIINMLLEKIDEIGGFNKFQMTPIKLAHDFTVEQGVHWTIALQIKNIGFNKSNLTNWTFNFITENNKKFNGKPIYSIQKINIKDNKQYPFSNLYELANAPLDQGASIVAAIQFNIDGLSQKMFNEKFTIILEAKDNKDRKVKFKIKSQTLLTEDYETIAELHDVVVNAF